MYQITSYPPTYGQCTICQKNDCGQSPDGEKWAHVGIELFKGGELAIGYKCIESMSKNLGITLEIVERQVLLTPNDEQIGDFVRKAVSTAFLKPQLLKEYGEGLADTLGESAYTPPINKMNRDQLKLWLKSINVDFVPQWGEERLREEALKHV